MEFLADDGDVKAAAYLLSVSIFEFVITLVTTEDCIKSLVQLSENLQEETCDLLKAALDAESNASGTCSAKQFKIHYGRIALKKCMFYQIYQ